MASSNTKFKVENGLDVVGQANVSGTLRVEGDLAVNGNLLTALNLAGDLKPTTNNTLNLGSSLLRWGYLYANNVDVFSNVSIGDTLTGNNASFANVIAAANNTSLGSATRRWALFANTVDFVTANGSTSIVVGANVVVNTTATAIGNSTSNVTTTYTGIGIGANVTLNTTQLFVGNTTVNAITTQSAITLSNNSVISTFNANSTTLGGTLNVAANLTVNTDLLFVDGTNKRVGIKNTAPSSAAVLTLTGNLEFSTVSTGVRYVTANTASNGSIQLTSNATVTTNRLTLNVYDSGNTTNDGGYRFTGTNTSATYTLLDFNFNGFQYKGGNVATSSNFGIYNVSGTRLGP